MTVEEIERAETIDNDFEALWLEANSFKQTASEFQGAEIEVGSADGAMPNIMLDYISDLAAHCHKNGLFDEFQLSKVLQCSKDQQTLFDEIAPSQLQAIVASFQND